MKPLEIKKMKVSDVKLADYNPRTIEKEEFEELKNNIEHFGLVEPLIFNEETGRLVGGHQRIKALQDLGIEEVEVSVVNLNEQEEKALNLALNKLSGDWDREKLRDILVSLHDESYDLNLTGFDEDEIQGILGKDWAPEFELGDFDDEEGEEISLKIDKASGTKYSQLILSKADHEELVNKCASLGKHFKTDNFADTVLASVRYAHKQLVPKDIQ